MIALLCVGVLMDLGVAVESLLVPSASREILPSSK